MLAVENSPAGFHGDTTAGPCAIPSTDTIRSSSGGVQILRSLGVCFIKFQMRLVILPKISLRGLDVFSLSSLVDVSQRCLWKIRPGLSKTAQEPLIALWKVEMGAIRVISR